MLSKLGRQVKKEWLLLVLEGDYAQHFPIANIPWLFLGYRKKTAQMNSRAYP